MAEIAPGAHVHPTARLGEGVIVLPNAWIGPGVTIGAGSIVEQNAVVGQHGPAEGAPVRIGRNCLIANGATIYRTAVLGDAVKVRHGAVVREDVEIGEGTSIGTGCSIEPHSRIGRFCSFHCKVHLTDFSSVGDYVFVGPGFISMSDLHLDYRRPHLHQGYQGVTIGRAARIGGGVIALPACEVGEETVVGAGSRIGGILKARMVYLGSPARAVRRVRPDEELGLRQ